MLGFRKFKIVFTDRIFYLWRNYLINGNGGRGYHR